MVKIPEKISEEVLSKYSIVNNAFKLDKIVNRELDKYKNEPKDEINVIVGDDKQPDIFYPQVKLERWSNEVNFSVRLIDNEIGTEKVSTLQNKIKWSKGNIGIEYYDYEEGEGGYKMVWYLKSDPRPTKTGNYKLDFSLQSKGLDFFYQPPLTQEYQNGYSEEFQKEIVVSETQVKDLEGNVLAECPEEYVDSWAIYHKTKGGMVDAWGKAYGTGKFGHIERIKIIDADGKTTWGHLDISDPIEIIGDTEYRIYSVEIPQEFLDIAVYPIKSNDTFGHTGTGAGTINIASRASGVNTSGRAGGVWTGSVGTLDKISVYVNTVWANKNVDFTAFVNTKNSGGAGSHGQVASSERLDLAITTTKTQYDFTCSSEVLSAVDYVLNLLANGSDLGTTDEYVAFRRDSAIIEGEDEYWTGAGGYASGKENPWTMSLTTAYWQFSIYATYTPAGPTQKSITDIGAGAETVSTKVQIGLVESGNGAEVLSNENSIPMTDLGSGIDSVLLIAKILASDTGTAAEIINILSKLVIQDTGQGTEALQILTALAISDNSVGTEAISSLVKIAISDSSLTTEAINILIKLAVQDSGLGSDIVTILRKTILTENGNGTDAINVLIKFATTDSVVGVEALQILSKLFLSDIGLGTEILSILSKLVLLDSGVGNEILALSNKFILTDSGIGSEAIDKSVVFLKSIQDQNLPSISYF